MRISFGELRLLEETSRAVKRARSELLRTSSISALLALLLAREWPERQGTSVTQRLDLRREHGFVLTCVRGTRRSWRGPAS